MAKAVFTAKRVSAYDDLVEERYHFPRTYLKQVERAVGDWIVYYEPRRTSRDLSSSGGLQAYFATARLTAVVPDPAQDDHYYAHVAEYLEFDRPVPFSFRGAYHESALRKPDGSTNKGAFGRAVRVLPDREYDSIVAAGFSTLLTPNDAGGAGVVSDDRWGWAGPEDDGERPRILSGRPDDDAAPDSTDEDVGEAVDGEDPDDQDEVEPVEIPEDAEWYVVHTYSGYENKVRQNLEHRIESMGMLDQIFQVVVPVEEEVDIKDGQRRIVERKIFPGYVLVRMILTDESWSVVRNTPAVTGFVGSGTDASDRLRPTPLRQEDVDRIMHRMESEEPTIRVSFRVGQNVRIVDGPFTDFHGVVDDIDMERGKVRLMVNFFGRETPVELDFLQVEKV